MNIIDSLTLEQANRMCSFAWGDLAPVVETTGCQSQTCSNRFPSQPVSTGLTRFRHRLKSVVREPVTPGNASHWHRVR